MDPAALLHYLADLATSTAAAASDLPGGVAPETIDVTRTGEPAQWLGDTVQMPVPTPAEAAARGVSARRTLSATAELRRMATLDALQPAEGLLRLGWVVVAGRITLDDRTVTCCFPLMSQPVRLTGPTWRRFTVHPTGAPELTPLVEDPTAAARLEAAAEYGGGALGPHSSFGTPTTALLGRLPRLRSWIRDVVAACGLPPVTDVLPSTTDPRTRRTKDGLVAVVGAILHVTRDVFRPSADAALRAWATGPDTAGTAFARVYGLPEPDPAPPPRSELGRPADNLLYTPLRLAPAQAEAVHRARTEAVTVISGPPGSGKSHTVAAMATDNVAQGGTVLVATRSRHAADVIARLLAREPGPDPVRFAGARDDEIVQHSTAPGAGSDQVETARRDLDEALARQQLAEAAVVRGLRREQQAERAPAWDGLVTELAARAPGAFRPDSDLAALTALAARSRAAPGASRWARWRSRRAGRRLRRSLRAERDAAPADLETALRCACDRRAAAELAADGGTRLDAAWEALSRAEADVRAAAGRSAAVEAAREDRRRIGRAAAADLATALRAGRRQRRRLLRELDGGRIVEALPLWVGSLRDVDDLLPETPALFDLVILDEASQIDQITGAGALLRARRAVVVGDPRQLRHVSFVSDAALGTALADHGLAAMAARLDVRRASVLDVASAAAPTTLLDEHYRSVPHLIAFSARRFYDDRLYVATRHPYNEATDVIDVVRAGDELAAALDRVAALAAAGATDIAVVSPFREVADAAEAALLAAYPLEDVQRLGLRVGTVHAFQGAEADHVVLVLGVGADDPAGRRRFVEDPHLFNVMVTRARRSQVVVTSLPPVDAAGSTGLIDEYLAHAEAPPAAPADGASPSAWAKELGGELVAAGVRVRTAYPVGRWSVDLCLGEAGAAVAVEVGVHPEGPPAHLARRRLLDAAGWQVVDAYPSRWDGDAARAAIELAASHREDADPGPASGGAAVYR